MKEITYFIWNTPFLELLPFAIIFSIIVNFTYCLLRGY